MPKSTIMDTNSFSADESVPLSAPIQQLTQLRQQFLGGAYRLFYKNPVHLVRGQGQYVWDAAGKKYLDAYNNVASIGHANPVVTQAVCQQMQLINTHTRYLHENILHYTEQLLATMPAEINKAMYMCTGSEANDLALRVACEYSGGQGIIVTKEAYHGTSALTSTVSPALGSGQPLAATTFLVEPPASYKLGTDKVSDVFAQNLQQAIDSMHSNGIKFAGVLADSIFSSDGIWVEPAGFLKAAVAVVHNNGGVWIADEVQPGFARTGAAFWGFGYHEIVPDIITTGKPMGNGFPVSGLFAKPHILAAFSDKLPYFNTFGGNPVAMAAAQAVLNYIQQHNLQQHTQWVGAKLRHELTKLIDKYDCVGEVRGIGLFIGFELVENRHNQLPAIDLALKVIEEMRLRGVLTSVCGAGNILKLRPPLVFAEQDIDWLVGALDESLAASLA